MQELLVTLADNPGLKPKLLISWGLIYSRMWLTLQFWMDGHLLSLPWRAGEMAQWLWALVALPEDSDSSPRAYTMVYNHS